MANPKPNIFSHGCPSRDLLELLAEKWALLVIFRLRIRPHRTAELRREVGGVSEKMLIQTLRKLERHGLVSRHDHGEVPPRVEYQLTRLGKSLSTPVEQLEQWVAKNIYEVLRSKETFDAKLARSKRSRAAA